MFLTKKMWSFSIRLQWEQCWGSRILTIDFRNWYFFYSHALQFPCHSIGMKFPCLFVGISSHIITCILFIILRPECLIESAAENRKRKAPYAGKSQTPFKMRHSNHKQEIKKKIGGLGQHYGGGGCGYESISIQIIEKVPEGDTKALENQEIYW